MELRPLIVLGVLLSLVVTNAVLISREGIARSEEQKSNDIKRDDPLGGIVYSSSDRARNFALFGLDEAGAERAVRKARVAEEDYGDKLRQLLLDASEPIALADALCGRTQDVRPRYGALAFLVEGKGDRREPISMRQASRLEVQGWSVGSSIQSVYTTAELGDSRPKDATVMALAAILEGQEDKVIGRERPWGRPATSEWSYSKVKESHPGVEEWVIEYLALMHVTVEIAQSSEGICG